MGWGGGGGFVIGIKQNRRGGKERGRRASNICGEAGCVCDKAKRSGGLCDP